MKCLRRFWLHTMLHVVFHYVQVMQGGLVHMLSPRGYSSAYRGPDGLLVQMAPNATSPPRRRTVSSTRPAPMTEPSGEGAQDDEAAAPSPKPAVKKALPRSSSSNHSESPASLPGKSGEKPPKVYAVANAGLPGVKWALVPDNKERDPWDNVVAGLPERTVTLPVAPMYPTMVPIQHQQSFHIPHWAVPQPVVTSPKDTELSPSSKHTEIFY
jgi:hypothetical protein